METTPSPELEPSALFSKSFDTLQKIPDQEDDGRMRVTGSAENPHLVQGQKVILMRSPDGVHSVGITLLDATDNAPNRNITVDLMSTGDGRDDMLASVALAPQRDPLGNEQIVTEVVAPPLTVLTEADQQFLDKVGLYDAVLQADMLTSNKVGDYQMAQYLASSAEVAAVGNLQHTVLDS